MLVFASVAATRGAAPPPKRADGQAPCTKYAAVDGSDSARGTERRPFRTPQRLVRALRKGQVGCLRGGTYTSSGLYVLDVHRPGVAIVSYPGEHAVLRGIVVVRPTAPNVRLADLSFEGGPVGSMNTVKVYSADFTLERSDLTNGGRGPSCLMLGSSEGGVATRPVIRRNRFHDCGNLANGNQDHAVYASHVVDGLITENVFWNVAGYSIQLYPHAQRTTFSHNVIDGGSSNRGGVVVGSESDGAPSSGNVVERNVIAFAASYNVMAYWGGAPGSGNVVRSNCVFGGGDGNIGAPVGFTAQGNITADPQFVNRAQHDLRLGPNSPCRKVTAATAVAEVLGVG